MLADPIHHKSCLLAAFILCPEGIVLRGNDLVRASRGYEDPARSGWTFRAGLALLWELYRQGLLRHAPGGGWALAVPWAAPAARMTDEAA